MPADASAMPTSRSISGSGGAAGASSRPMTSTSNMTALLGAAGAVCRAQLGRRALRVLRVGLDDALHEAVAHHVGAAEAHEVDALDPVEDVANDDKAGVVLLRQVDLGDVARDDHLRVEAQAREEHLHLLGRRVLR